MLNAALLAYPVDETTWHGGVLRHLMPTQPAGAFFEIDTTIGILDMLDPTSFTPKCSSSIPSRMGEPHELHLTAKWPAIL